MRSFNEITDNGSAAWRRSGLERQNFQLCTNVSKTIFSFAELQKTAKEKWFCGLNAQKFNLARNPLFCQTAC